MQFHIQSSDRKNPRYNENKIEHEPKIRKIIENILEINLINKKLTKSNSFPHHRLNLNDESEKEIVNIKKSKEKENAISSNNKIDDNNENKSKKNYERKNFILKSEIFNLNRDVKNYSISVSKKNENKNLNQKFDTQTKTHKESENKNNNLIIIQLMQSNRSEINNNNFQNNLNNINYISNTFQPSLSQNLSGALITNLNKYYNYNKVNNINYANRYYNSFYKIIIDI